ncbi:hypothetical protein SAMN05421863_101817 [Nitrosomonas communis]|uniref:Uncharacterized protein n=1 Tax=Nitrosomonas communis TaxID=44574 RepID=A0A1I4P5C6_9PROT|nr:hypothetical protein SAMN05421863_101817 [Nitrosomonas communis]
MNKPISKSPLDHLGRILIVRIKLSEPPDRIKSGFQQTQAKRCNDANDKYDKVKST